MKVGIIGLGVVGGACKKGFELQGHKVLVHDLNLKTSIDCVLEADIIYICVPTSVTVNGHSNHQSVSDVVGLLDNKKYQGVVALKSTVTPGTTDIFNKTTGMTVCFVPEFLRERCAEDDFIKNHKLLVVGTQKMHAYQLVVESHGNLPKHIQQLSEIEAELLKYYSNTFNAMRVVFSNIMYEVCKKTGADYDKIKNSYLLREVASPDYMDCNENLRGFGGKCLPKDLSIFKNYLKDKEIDVGLFQAIENDNKKFKSTVFKGMRE